MRVLRWLTVLLVVLAFLMLSDSSWACEGCKNFSAISGDKDIKMVQAGYSWSILFMIFVPLTLLGWLVRMMVKVCQEKDR